MDPIVIIGTGLAGYTVAREFRKLDADTPLVMLTADDGEFYSKPNLSTALTNQHSPADLVNTPAAQMADQLNAEIRTDVRVEAILPDQHRIRYDGRVQDYRQLVLGLGADPIRLKLAGDGADAVYSINDLRDYKRWRTDLEACRRIAILGAGLIGCEFANDLINSGYEVAVIDPNPLPLYGLLPEAAGRQLADALERLGLEWHLGTTASSVDRNGADLSVSLADGATVTAQRVLSAVGLRPRIQLAQGADLATARGIQVDRLLRSSDADIYALGDCAEVEGLVLPFVMPIMHAGRALARTLAGEPTAVVYPSMPVVVKTPAYPLAVLPPGRGVSGAWTAEEGDDHAVRALFRTLEGELRGFALGGGAVREKMKLLKDLPPLLA